MQESGHDTVQPLLLTVFHIAQMFSLGYMKVYELIATELLPVECFGRAKRISPVSLKRLLENREQKA